MSRNFFLPILLLICLMPTIQAEPVLSGFKGSVEKGVYQTDYAAFFFAKAAPKEPEVNKIEGALFSRVFTKPENKSNLELFRSYEKELRKGGFTILLAATPSDDNNPTYMLRKLYRGNKGNALHARHYKKSAGSVYTMDLDRIATQGDYYLSAVKKTADTTLHVALVLSRNNLYLIDEVKSATMEQGTVTLNLEAMRQAIADAGKIAIYDIFFKTGSAEITADSAPALKVIADYLHEDKGNFYIVGHTDDTGALNTNLRLSEQRAGAVKQALTRDYGITARRLETRGVGPLAPASTNASPAGRKLNRRVEVVKRLG